MISLQWKMGDEQQRRRLCCPKPRSRQSFRRNAGDISRHKLLDFIGGTGFFLRIFVRYIHAIGQNRLRKRRFIHPLQARDPCRNARLARCKINAQWALISVLLCAVGNLPPSRKNGGGSPQIGVLVFYYVIIIGEKVKMDAENSEMCIFSDGKIWLFLWWTEKIMRRNSRFCLSAAF
jgi:hypothetical protein